MTTKLFVGCRFGNGQKKRKGTVKHFLFNGNVLHTPTRITLTHFFDVS
jgi:hypothetical protein